MKKQKNAVAVHISFLKRFLLFFGVIRWFTWSEARALFNSAKHPVPYGLEGWVKAKIWVYIFTPNWKKIFFHWLSLAESEGQAKDCFFCACGSTYGTGKDHPLRSTAAKKWLTFLTDPLNEYHRRMVWRLSSQCDIWIEAGTIGNVLARQRRTEFAWEMIHRAEGNRDALFEAEFWAPEESDAKVYVRRLLQERITV